MSDHETSPSALRLFFSRDYAPVHFLLLAYAVLSLCNGWLVDDAYITFRVSDNIVNGYGLRWNVLERVQVYTHPLWMILFTAAHFVTRETYLTAILLSWITSILAVLISAIALTNSSRSAFFLLFALLFSKAFVDYSSSGLENPLTHLLLALFLLTYIREPGSSRKVLFATLLAALAVVNRHDSILLVLPALLHTFWVNRSTQALFMVLLGGLPFIAWEIFSLIYYGFPLPNTAWAKLNSGISFDILLRTATNYYLQSIMFDHVTLLIIFSGIIVAFGIRKNRMWFLGLGLALHLLYIFRIGGDYMSGRFFSSPFLLAVIIISQVDWRSLPQRSFILILFAIALAGATNPFPTFYVNPLSGYAEELQSFNMYRNVKDERAYYYRNTGFLAGFGKSKWPDSPWRTMGEELRSSDAKVFSFHAVGLLGYYAGPDVYIVDELSLGDPLTARLQFANSERQRTTFHLRTHSDYMPGHLERVPPEGYLDSLRSGENIIVDPHLNEYYDYLRIVTQGPVWASERWRAIWLLNTGGLNELLDRYENPSKYSDSPAP